MVKAGQPWAGHPPVCCAHGSAVAPFTSHIRSASCHRIGLQEKQCYCPIVSLETEEPMEKTFNVAEP